MKAITPTLTVVAKGEINNCSLQLLGNQSLFTLTAGAKREIPHAIKQLISEQPFYLNCYYISRESTPTCIAVVRRASTHTITAVVRKTITPCF